MTDPIIKVDGLGKTYRIHHELREPYTTLRDVLAKRVGSILSPRRAKERAHARNEEFWALKDVSFEVQPGEIVGIVGRNGAGKSTLLKILSRITEPTAGRIELDGRVSSLLEVGTGFHPELTGRENVYLNGSILGMTRREVQRKFDEIVAFAEVERFIDTPVKRYSSGMYMRLAFAVAAHMEPEVLIVDEVLAVGDAEFQKKCLGKMGEVAGRGRTVLFVSHNMASVEALCETAIHLDQGSVVAHGPAQKIIAGYNAAYAKSALDSEFETRAIQDGLLLTNIQVCPRNLQSTSSASFALHFAVKRTATIRELAILFYSALGQRLAICDLREFTELPVTLRSGVQILTTTIQRLPFVEGFYSIGLYIKTDGFAGDLMDVRSFEILPAAALNGFVAYDSGARGVVSLSARMVLAQADPPPPPALAYAVGCS